MSGSGDDVPQARRDRRAELIAAAVSNELSDAERSELAVLRSEDPSVDPEIRELHATLGQLSGVATSWDDFAPSPELRARVTDIGRQDAPARWRWSGWATAAAAAACVAIGAGTVLGIQALASAPVTGEPGVLGALEPVEFEGSPDGASVDGAVVAHTWGTETVLEIDGLNAGDSYTVVLVERDGDELPSGTFLGSDVTITCRMNAAVMRPDVATVVIEDAAGRTVSTADLPETEGV